MNDAALDEDCDDAATLALVADRLREVDDLLGDREPFVKYLIHLSYVASIEAYGSLRKR